MFSHCRRLVAASSFAAAATAAALGPQCSSSAEPRAPRLTIVSMGGTIDKDYPRSISGYAFEIDEPAAGRVLEALPSNIGMSYDIVSVCRKDSTEIDEQDRKALCEAVRAVPVGGRIVVTHGTDTMVESAQCVAESGAAQGKAVCFTGAMRPEKFKDSDAAFNLGGAVAAAGLLPPGSVAICMGGAVIESRFCQRDARTHRFVDTRAAA